MSASWLFVMWDGGGNVGPFLCLADQLRARGHRVEAVATSSLRPRLADAGIALVGEPDGWLPGADGLVQAVEAHQPDGLVVDYMLTGALCGAETTGLPVVALVHTLYRELLVDGAPHPMQMAGSVAQVNEARAALDLAPVDTHADLLAAADRVVVSAPRQLDAPGDVPDNVAYVGALAEGPGPDDGWEPPTGDGPVVVVSTGTSSSDPDVQTDLVGRIVVALGRLPVRGVVTVPPYVDRSRLHTTPHVVVSGYVRHAAVLPHADALVTHAGLGSVLAGLAHGVPMVCLPLDREQPDNARAVERIGAGAGLPPDSSPDVIATAIRDQLERERPAPVPADPGRAAAQVASVLSG